MDKVSHVASIYSTDVFRCWPQRQDWNFKTSWLAYPKTKRSALTKEFSFKSMQTGIRPFGIGCAKQGLSRWRETLSRVLWVVSCSRWTCQAKQTRIISTGHKMTLVNGFRAHHNGFVGADLQVVAEGLLFCTDRGLKSRRDRAWEMEVRPWDREVALPSLSSSERQQRRCDRWNFDGLDFTQASA